VTADVLLLSGSQVLPEVSSAYLDAYLQPFRHWLERDTVTEILVNRPG
jgi:type IV secretion system protein VirB11